MSTKGMRAKMEELKFLERNPIFDAHFLFLNFRSILSKNSQIWNSAFLANYKLYSPMYILYLNNFLFYSQIANPHFPKTQPTQIRPKRSALLFPQSPLSNAPPSPIKKEKFSVCSFWSSAIFPDPKIHPAAPF